MENPISIRAATEQDADAVYDFVCRLEDTVFDYEQFLRVYRATLNAPNNIYLIAEDGQQPVGYLSCFGQLLLHHMGMVYEIQELFVADAYRSKGIGKQLVLHLEDILGARPCELLEVSSNRTRTEAHRFYERYGFAQSHLKFTK